MPSLKILLMTVIFSMVIWTITAIGIPMIDNTILVSRIPIHTNTLNNVTCDDCLCQTVPHYTILNCFPNNTCQYFQTTPLRYQLKTMRGARLFFPTGVLPNKSQCCQPNLTDVIAKLQNGSRQTIKISHPRCLVLDLHGQILYFPELHTGYLKEYSARNMTLLRQLNLSFSEPISLVEHQGILYVAYHSSPILMVDKQNFTVINMIHASELEGARDIIFLRDGEVMVVAATLTMSLVFFKRSNASQSTLYTFDFKQTLDSISPHGLFYITDTFFYASSYFNNQVYSFTQVNDTYWHPQLMINASSVTKFYQGNHILIDECERFWFALGHHGFHISSREGTYLDSFIVAPDYYTFHAVITDNYVLYVSGSDSGQITRIDPEIQC